MRFLDSYFFTVPTRDEIGSADCKPRIHAATENAMDVYSGNIASHCSNDAEQLQPQLKNVPNESPVAVQHALAR